MIGWRQMNWNVQSSSHRRELAFIFRVVSLFDILSGENLTFAGLRVLLFQVTSIFGSVNFVLVADGYIYDDLQ